MTRNNDRSLTRSQAQLLQNEPRDRYLLWTIYVSPKDFPGLVIARPFLADELYRPLPCHIEAETIEAVRAALPAGAHCIGRDKRTDPAIHEVWIR
jgi:hypothetical protein